jgi:hypothetical protein
VGTITDESVLQTSANLMHLASSRQLGMAVNEQNTVTFDSKNEQIRLKPRTSGLFKKEQKYGYMEIAWPGNIRSAREGTVYGALYSSAIAELRAQIPRECPAYKQVWSV